MPLNINCTLANHAAASFGKKQNKKAEQKNECTCPNHGTAHQARNKAMTAAMVLASLGLTTGCTPSVEKMCERDNARIEKYDNNIKKLKAEFFDSSLDNDKKFEILNKLNDELNEAIVFHALRESKTNSYDYKEKSDSVFYASDAKIQELMNLKDSLNNLKLKLCYEDLSEINKMMDEE